jgi:nitrogen-specific signal transduction histidine kinase/ActR/RegA family two-component response regulator
MDITRLRELEAQLQHSQKVESLGTMVGGIAHDFNNLLTAIAGNITVAQKRCATGRDPSQNLSNIEAACRKASDLCQQMLAYAGQNRPARTPCDLNAIAREIADLARAAVDDRIQLAFDLAPERPAILASAGQVGQVILNLLNNAADAIEEHGAITVSTELIQLEEPLTTGFPEPPVPGRYVRLSVADSGGGIDNADLARIFDPFYSTKADGHGLGLSAVLGICSAHESKIVVTSEIDRGTTFSVYFPEHESAASESSAAQPRNETRSGEGTVLVVDDDSAVRIMLDLLLQEAGYTVIEACDGDEALEKIAANSQSISIVILDVTMPKRDGYSTLKELRKTHPTLPVLLSSGRPIQLDDAGRADQYLKVLEKPYEAEKLLSVVAETANLSESPASVK